jgi:hypothetical protein
MRKQRFKEAPANFSMQAAYPVHRSAAADCQIGHIETFRAVIRVLAAEGE